MCVAGELLRPTDEYEALKNGPQFDDAESSVVS